MPGKYVVKVYDRRTLRTRTYHGPYKTRRDALKVAKREQKAHGHNKNIGIGIVN